MRPDYETPIAHHIAPGEQLLWVGRPKQGVVFQASDIYTIPFSLLWGGFAIAWVAAVLRGAAAAPGVVKLIPLAMAAFGSLFVVAGLYFIFGRFLWDAYLRTQTHYGLTDRRALILTLKPIPRTTSLPLHTMGEIDLVEHRDGTGSILFGQTAWASLRPRHMQWPGQSAVPKFDHIGDAAEVYRLIQAHCSRSEPVA